MTQELAEHSPVPVLNALSSLWHPTQTLADLLTLHEHASLFSDLAENTQSHSPKRLPQLSPLRPLTIAYVGDSANVLHDMLVTYPRLGHKLRIASPDDPKYRAPKPVWDRVLELGCDTGIWWGADPREAVRDADVVVTDTWLVLHFLSPVPTQLQLVISTRHQDLDGSRSGEGRKARGFQRISSHRGTMPRGRRQPRLEVPALSS